MSPFIESYRLKLHQLCQAYHVARLDLFGSAASNRFDPTHSDLDFVVEFQPLDHDQYSDAYFGLLFALQQLFERPVDLITRRSIRNPYFLQMLEQAQRSLYAA